MTATEAAAAPRKPHLVKRLYSWVLSWAETPYGSPALFVIAFAESSFFPIPPDVLQIALSVGKPRRSFFYAAVATAGSVLGGILGWYIGHALWESTASFFFEYVPGFTQENFHKVGARYNEHSFLAIFGAAFTPIPFKVFTIASGVFEVTLGTLLLASTLGRGLRFFIVGSTIFLFGPRVKALIEKYFELVTLGLLVLGIGGFVAVKYLF
jgi:membrane protein YqaA with SNARE-associated domain